MVHMFFSDFSFLFLVFKFDSIVWGPGAEYGGNIVFIFTIENRAYTIRELNPMPQDLHSSVLPTEPTVE